MFFSKLTFLTTDAIKEEMRMKSTGIHILLIFFSCAIYAQIEKPLSSLKIDDKSNLGATNYSLSPGLTKPKNNFTLYKSTKDSIRFNRTQKPFDMTGNNGLLKPNHGEFMSMMMLFDLVYI